MNKCLCICEYGNKSTDNLFSLFNQGEYYDFEMIDNGFRIYLSYDDQWVEYIPEYFYKYFSLSEYIDSKINTIFL